AAGVDGLSADLSLPTLVPALCRALGLDAATTEALRGALDHKDAAAVSAVGGRAPELLSRLLAGAGAARKALGTLNALDLPDEAAAERQRLARVVDRLAGVAPG